MHYRIKKFLRYMLIFAAWVFFLSIRIGDRTLFAHAHDLLVDNRIVAAVDAEVTDLWDRITMTARTAYGRVTPPVVLPTPLGLPSGASGDSATGKGNSVAGGAANATPAEHAGGKTDVALPHIPASAATQAKG